MPSLKELDDERIYHDGLEIKRLREELENANKTIEHLTRAYKVLRDRLELAHSHNRTLRKLMIKQARDERTIR